jgi:hypothetical protein
VLEWTGSKVAGNELRGAMGLVFKVAAQGWKGTWDSEGGALGWPRDPHRANELADAAVVCSLRSILPSSAKTLLPGGLTIFLPPHVATRQGSDRIRNMLLPLIVSAAL